MAFLKVRFFLTGEFFEEAESYRTISLSGCSSTTMGSELSQLELLTSMTGSAVLSTTRSDMFNSFTFAISLRGLVGYLLRAVVFESLRVIVD